MGIERKIRDLGLAAILLFGPIDITALLATNLIYKNHLHQTKVHELIQISDSVWHTNRELSQDEISMVLDDLLSLKDDGLLESDSFMVILTCPHSSNKNCIDIETPNNLDEENNIKTTMSSRKVNILDVYFFGIISATSIGTSCNGVIDMNMSSDYNSYAYVSRSNCTTTVILDFVKSIEDDLNSKGLKLDLTKNLSVSPFKD